MAKNEKRPAYELILDYIANKTRCFYAFPDSERANSYYDTICDLAAILCKMYVPKSEVPIVLLRLEMIAAENSRPRTDGDSRVADLLSRILKSLSEDNELMP